MSNTSNPHRALTLIFQEMELCEDDFAKSEAYTTIADIVLRSLKGAGFSIEPADPYLRKARAERDISVLEIARACGLAINGVNPDEPNPNGRSG